MKIAVLGILVALVATPAVASLPRDVLQRVGADPPANARLDLALSAPDISGRSTTLASIAGGKPMFVAFVDYTCNTLCSTSIQLLTAAIDSAHLDPDTFRIVIIGIDPTDTAQAALAMERAEIPARLQPATVFLLPDAATVTRATSALGYRYAYDRAADQFAHPAVVYVLAPDGHVRRLLSPFALTTADMRTVLDASGDGVPATSLYHRIGLLCYAYDPAHGTYSLRIDFILKIAGVLTVALTGAAIALLLHRARHTP